MMEVEEAEEEELDTKRGQAHTHTHTHTHSQHKNPSGYAAQHARETHLLLSTNAPGGDLKNKAPSALDLARVT